MYTAEFFGLIIRNCQVSVLDFMSKTNIVKKFESTFTGLGCFNRKCSLRTIENATPVYNAPRRVPLALHAKLKETSETMVTDGIIARVDLPKGWVNNLVIIEKKDGNLKIFLDPRELNKVLIQEKFLIPNIDELRSKFCDSKYFSVLDLSSGFWQVPLTDESAELCTFNSPFGLPQILEITFRCQCRSRNFPKVHPRAVS